MARKGRPRSVSPPPEFSDDAQTLWRACVRQLQEQGTWRPVDGPLLESYVQSVITARAARRAGQHDMAAAAEDRAAVRASALMLTPESRRHAPNGKPHRVPNVGNGHVEASTTVIS